VYRPYCLRPCMGQKVVSLWKKRIWLQKHDLPLAILCITLLSQEVRWYEIFSTVPFSLCFMIVLPHSLPFCPLLLLNNGTAVCRPSSLLQNILICRSVIRGNICYDSHMTSRNTNSVPNYINSIYKIRGGIQYFPDWPPGAENANGTAVWH